jgi:dihydrofolate reductase
MGTVYANLSISLDGYAAGPNDSPEHPLGVGGEQLHEWREDPKTAGIVEEFFKGYGAVVVGRRTFDLGEPFWRPDPPYFAPVFVPTHRPRESTTIGDAVVTFVTGGISDAFAQARAAAGDDRIWVIGGGTTVREAMLAGELDELQVQVVPVVLGGGPRLFDDPALADVRLEQDRVLDGGGVTHIRWRVRRAK